MHIGILALQGAFIEHAKMLDRLNVEHHEIRCLEDLKKPMDGLIIPGGESTTMSKLLLDLNMFDQLQEMIIHGLPVFGTCAGMIMLADSTSNNHVKTLRTFKIVVKRNAYGRQLGSFYVTSEILGIGEFPMVFIRAPYVESTSDEVEVLARVDGHIVACRQDKQLATAFHPELTDNTALHQYFLNMCE
ncbi:MAG: pyridoxal 5'-phosphate synthase glutaminase subunit PdxT [Bacilli bacterium]|nr:pyridoxal 5'-phosphate synthase glutaminase subunit PdxT [Bacilli bacterium]